jgi:hypothetical protein
VRVLRRKEELDRGPSTGAPVFAYPALLEAILGAKEAVLDAQAQALGTLEGTTLIVAILPQAFPLRGRLCSHGDLGRWLFEVRDA